MMSNKISTNPFQRAQISVLNLGLDIESVRINSLIDLLILVIIGLAVQVA